jgi:hypothetical protein|tara:strand:- start:386 stop:730 length:345 start_codon:yes stop_codon:yes gene_type:complete
MSENMVDEKNGNKKENSDLVNAGVLWSTEAKSGLQYWSGKLNLSDITDSLIEQKGISDQADLVGLLQGKTDLDLMMFVNNNRRPDKNDPMLLLKVKVKVEEQVEPVKDEDLPPH